MKYGTILCVVFHFLLPLRPKYKKNDMTFALVCFAIGIVCYMLSRSMKNEQAAKEDLAKSEAYNRLLEEEIPCQCGNNIIQLCESIKTSSKVIEQWMDEPESEEAESIRTSEGDLRLSRYMIQCLVDQVERAKHAGIEREYIEFSTAGDMLLWYRQVLEYLKRTSYGIKVIVERMNDTVMTNGSDAEICDKVRAYAHLYGILYSNVQMIGRICEQDLSNDDLMPLMEAVRKIVFHLQNQMAAAPLSPSFRIEPNDVLIDEAIVAARRLYDMWNPLDERVMACHKPRSMKTEQILNVHGDLNVKDEATFNGPVVVNGNLNEN